MSATLVLIGGAFASARFAGIIVAFRARPTRRSVPLHGRRGHCADHTRHGQLGPSSAPSAAPPWCLAWCSVRPCSSWPGDLLTRCDRAPWTPGPTAPPAMPRPTRHCAIASWRSSSRSLLLVPSVSRWSWHSAASRIFLNATKLFRCCRLGRSDRHHHLRTGHPLCGPAQDEQERHRRSCACGRRRQVIAGGIVTAVDGQRDFEHHSEIITVTTMVRSTVKTIRKREKPVSDSQSACWALP